MKALKILALISAVACGIACVAFDKGLFYIDSSRTPKARPDNYDINFVMMDVTLLNGEESVIYVQKDSDLWACDHGEAFMDLVYSYESHTMNRCNQDFRTEEFKWFRTDIGEGFKENIDYARSLKKVLHTLNDGWAQRVHHYNARDLDTYPKDISVFANVYSDFDNGIYENMVEM